MLKKIIAACAALLITASVQADVAPGKLVIYRADEAKRTRSIKFHASIDNRSLGRLQYKSPVVASVEPGTYTLGTSLQGEEDLQIEVKPGTTYYVFAGVRKFGQRVTPSLQVVEEQDAVAQKPAIGQLVQNPV